MKFDIEKYTKEILFNRQDVQKWIDEEVKVIESSPNYDPSSTAFVAILDGAIPFFNELTMSLSNHIMADNIKISSYNGTERIESKVSKDLTGSVEGKVVYIIDEIWDSGKTIELAKEFLLMKGAKEVKSIVMIYKEHTSVVESKPDHFFYNLKTDDWLVGFGLDCNGFCRNIPKVVSLNEDGIKSLKRKK